MVISVHFVVAIPYPVSLLVCVWFDRRKHLGATPLSIVPCIRRSLTVELVYAEGEEGNLGIHGVHRVRSISARAFLWGPDCNNEPYWDTGVQKLRK